MINLTERYAMIDPINDLSKFKSLDTKSDPSTKNQPHQQEAEAKHVDDVSLSSTSKQIEALKNYIIQTPIDNDSKINLIKEDIAQGRYEINHEAIASKLIAASR